MSAGLLFIAPMPTDKPPLSEVNYRPAKKSPHKERDSVAEEMTGDTLFDTLL